MNKILFHFLCYVCIFLMACSNGNIFSWTHSRTAKLDKNAPYESLVEAGKSAMEIGDFEYSRECFKAAQNQKTSDDEGEVAVFLAEATLAEVVGGVGGLTKVLEAASPEGGERCLSIFDNVVEKVTQIRENAENLKNSKIEGESSKMTALLTFALASVAEVATNDDVKSSKVLKDFRDRIGDSGFNFNETIRSLLDDSTNKELADLCDKEGVRLSLQKSKDNLGQVRKILNSVDPALLLPILQNTGITTETINGTIASIEDRLRPKN